MVDELGAGIHYSLLPKVCAALGTAARKYNSQLICTTHSYEFVETAKVGMAGADQADLSYVRLDRVAEEVTARTYDYSALAAAVDQSWEVR